MHCFPVAFALDKPALEMLAGCFAGSKLHLAWKWNFQEISTWSQTRYYYPSKTNLFLFHHMQRSKVGARTVDEMKLLKLWRVREDVWLVTLH